MANIARFSGTIYPDKSFSLGIVPKSKARQEDRKYEYSMRNQEATNAGCLSDWLEEKVYIGGKFCSLSDHEELEENKLKARPVSAHDMEVLQEMDKVKDGDFSKFYDVAPPSEAPLFIKSPKSSRKKRSPYGSNGITTYGKRVVKNGALLLERKYGKSRLGFVTCSLPSLPAVDHHLLNGNWSEVVRRFYQKLRRQFEKLSEQFIYLGVTEIQEKRFKKYGIPAPHLHFVYVARSSSRSAYSLYICQLHRAWNESVQEGLERAGSTYSLLENKSWGSVHAKVVRKSASAYLGKYLTKGGQVLGDMIEQGWTEFPKQWWTACLRVKEIYKEAVVRMSQDDASWFFFDSEELYERGLFAWMQSIWIEVGGYSYRVGLTGILSDEMYAAVVGSR